jgi:hypothetical protein
MHQNKWSSHQRTVDKGHHQSLVKGCFVEWLSSTFASCWKKEGVRVVRKWKKEAAEEDKANGGDPGKREISHEPISESAPTGADCGEEREPKGEGCYESHPDLKR